MASTMSHHRAAGVREDRRMGKGFLRSSQTRQRPCSCTADIHALLADKRMGHRHQRRGSERASDQTRRPTHRQHKEQDYRLQETMLAFYQLQHHETMGLSKPVVCTQMTKTKLHFQSPSAEGRWGGGGRKGAGGGVGVDVRISVYGKRKLRSKLFKWLELGGCRDAGCWVG